MSRGFSYLSIQNVQAVWRGTPTLSLDVKLVIVFGEKLLGEKARCSGAVKRWATDGCADIGRVAIELPVSDTKGEVI